MKLFHLLFVLGMLVSATAQPTQQWISTTNGTAENQDRANALTTDATGNVYVAGYAIKQGDWRNAWAAKYSASGTLLWTFDLNVASNKTDELKAIATDNAGYVYVAGVGYSNILVAKLNASTGDTLWVRTYNGAGQDYDEATSVAVDAAGNVYVAGKSDVNEFTAINYDYVVVKYNASGVFQWAATYAGAGGAEDIANDLVLDGTGNVYVTGEVTNVNMDKDLVTIKYSPAGAAVWTRTLNRAGGDDTGEALDFENNYVYVTGKSDNGNDDDYVLIKYDLNGVAAWTRYRDGGDTDRGVDVKADASDNVFVTGRSANAGYGDYDIVTLKYSPAGTLLWANTMAGVAGLDDRPSALAVDNASNVYVVGREGVGYLLDDIVVFKCSAGGLTQAWKAVYGDTGGGDDSGTGIALNATASSVYVCGQGYANATQFDALLMARSASTGAQQWLRRYDGGGESTDRFRKLATDALGNVYAVGFAYRTNFERDIVICKTNAAGTVLWRNYYTSPADPQAEDEAFDIALDAAGNAYVAGVSDKDLILLKYAANGTQQWAVVHNGVGNSFDEANAVAVDNAGNVFVTGRSDRDSAAISNYSIKTFKYSPLGVLLNTATYSGTTSNQPESMALDTAGNVYITGNSQSGLYENVLLIKYDNALAQQWVRTYGASNTGDDNGNELAIYGNNVYVAGYMYDGVATNCLVLKYNDIGTLVWAKAYNASGEEKLFDIAVDHAENIVACGRTFNGTNFDAFVIKYNSAGTQLFAKTYNNNSDERYNDVALDCAGNIYVAGAQSSTNGLYTDLLLQKYYAVSGSLASTTTYNNAAANLDDESFDISVVASNTNQNTLVLCGISEGTTTQADALIAQYNDATFSPITGNASVCNQVYTNTYSVEAAVNATYTWTVTNGTIQSGQGTPTVTVLWNTPTSNTTGTINCSVSVLP